MYSSNYIASGSCACTTVKKLSRVLVRTYDEALGDSEINITQLAVIRCIARRAGEPLSRVAEELEMDRSSLYRAITPMVRDGWIKTTPGGDARSLVAKITSKGQKLLTEADTRWDTVQGHLIDVFGKGEWAALVKEINRLAACAGAVSASRDFSCR